MKKRSLVRIPVVEPWIDAQEKKWLDKVVSSGWVTEHDLTHEFESLLKTYTKAKFALAVTNGTAGLFVALKAIGIGPGDEVLVPDLTFIATANAVIMAGARPVLVDVDLHTFGIDIRAAERKITKKTKAIIPVHLYGFAADMDAVMKLAKKYRLFVVEDAAQGMGVFYKSKHLGTLGHIGMISFFGNKTMTCGEGAILLTNKEYFHRKSYRLKNHGRNNRGTFIHTDIGFNFSFTEMQAALGIAQFHKLRRIIARKKQIRDLYEHILKDVPDCRFWKTPPHVRSVFWFTNVLVPDAAGLSHFLEEKGVQSRRFFYPLHKQPCYRHLRFGKKFPNAVYLYKHGLSLPSSVTTPLHEIRRVAFLVKEYFS